MDGIDFQPVSDGIDFQPVQDGIDFQPVGDGIDFEPDPSQLGGMLRQETPPLPVSTLTQPYLYVPKDAGTGPLTIGTAPQPADLSALDEKFTALKAMASNDPAQFKEVEAERQAALKQAGVGVVDSAIRAKLPRMPQATSTIGKVGSGLVNAGAGLVEGVLQPEAIAGVAALPARMVSALFALNMAADAPQVVKETAKAVQDGDWQKATEYGSSGVVGMWLTRKLGEHAMRGPDTMLPVYKELEAAVKKTEPMPGAIDIEAINNLSPQAEARIPREGLRVDEGGKPLPAEPAGEPARASRETTLPETPGKLEEPAIDFQPVEPSTNPEEISSSPAEPGGRPAEAHTAIEPGPVETRMGIAPTGTSAFASFFRAVSPESIAGTFKGLAGHSLPRITQASQEAGESGVRFASSKIAAKPLAVMFTDRVLGGSGVDAGKFGAALAEDNLRSVAQTAPDPSAVATIIGQRGSPFRTEAEYQSFLKLPAVIKAIQRHIEAWNEIIEPQYRAAQAIDPSVVLPPRGLQTGARVNLMALDPTVRGARPVSAGTARGNLTASFKRKSPFARQAKGTGQSYEISYPDIIANTFNKQLEIANQNAFNRLLVDKGLAQIGPPGKVVPIGGQPSVAFPLSRRVILSDGRTIPAGQNLYLRADLAREYRAALDTDAATKFPGLSHLNAIANSAALIGLTDASVHMGNLMTVLATRPGGHLVLDSLAKATGRVDMPIIIYKLISKAFSDNKAQIAKLAEIGALREAHPPGNMFNPMTHLGSLIQLADKTTRLVMDDVFTKLADQGIAERSETNRREFINQVGQYNKRLQGPLVRFARDSGLGPFATAGTTFNRLGLRNITMSPGMKATSPLAAVALRANVVAGWVGAAALAMSINWMLTKDKGGGVMGRPGVPLGRIDTGKDDENGRPLSFAFFDNLGYGRALRVTGVAGYANMKRLGASSTVASEKAMTDVANGWTSPFFGPAVQAASVIGTGHHAAIGVPAVAPVASPNQNQFWLNAKAAGREANPVVASYIDRKEGKTVGESLSRQLPRLTLKAGMDEQKAGKMGEIMDAVKAKNYIDSLIRESKRLPVEKRWEFIQKRYEADGLPMQYVPRLVQEFKRHGRY